jgi:hypothetical protein
MASQASDRPPALLRMTAPLRDDFDIPYHTIYDGFDGRVREKVLAPAGGFLSGLRRQPLLFEGDLIARLQTHETVGHAADTYMAGQGQ